MLTQFTVSKLRSPNRPPSWVLTYHPLVGHPPTACLYLASSPRVARYLPIPPYSFPSLCCIINNSLPYFVPVPSLSPHTSGMISAGRMYVYNHHHAVNLRNIVFFSGCEIGMVTVSSKCFNNCGKRANDAPTITKPTSPTAGNQRYTFFVRHLPHDVSAPSCGSMLHELSSALNVPSAPSLDSEDMVSRSVCGTEP